MYPIAPRLPAARSAALALLCSALLSGCEPPPWSPTPPDYEGARNQALQSAFSCEGAGFVGRVIEGAPDWNLPVRDAVVDGRYPGAAFDPANEARTGTDGRYRLCLTIPPDCESGACNAEVEIRARKDGYVTAARTLKFAYDHWGYSALQVDLELVPERALVTFGLKAV